MSSFGEAEVLAALHDATHAYDVVRGYWWQRINAAAAAGFADDYLAEELGMSVAELNRERRKMAKVDRSYRRYVALVSSEQKS